MADIMGEVTVPIRSRTFTEDDARQVLALLNGEADGQDGPAENVGFGSFKTPGAARSAGVTLNRLLRNLGAEQNYAVTTFTRDGQTVGVVLNKPARQRAEGGGRKRGSRGRRS